MVKGRVHFDEAIISEHDKERGTRMKIDEPDTPFARSPMRTDSEDDNKSQKLMFFPEGAGSASSGQNEKDDDSEGTRKAFIQQRKEHYNEIKMARALNSRKLSEEAFSEPDRKD